MAYADENINNVSTDSMVAIHQSNMIKSLYDTVPNYNRDVQKLMEFIDKVETYFEIMDLEPEQQLQAASLKLSGTAALL